MGCYRDIVQDYYSLLCLRLKGRMVVRGHTDSTGGGGGVRNVDCLYCSQSVFQRMMLVQEWT